MTGMREDGSVEDVQGRPGGTLEDDERTEGEGAGGKDVEGEGESEGDSCDARPTAGVVHEFNVASIHIHGMPQLFTALLSLTRN